MNSIPFLYVNLFALFAYVILFLTFWSAQKTPEVRSFMLLLSGFILWTLGSVLMRIGLWPNMQFWFYVSITALFTDSLLIYLFVHRFTKQKGHFMPILWAAGTLVIDILTCFGIFLKPPMMVIRENGEKLFTYEMNLLILIPLLFILCMGVAVGFMIAGTAREKGFKTPGLIPIMIGASCIVVGNMVQIIPGNVFPWDTLGGIAFAVLIVWALYNKRMFRLNLLVSRSVLMGLSLLLCALMASFYVEPVKDFLCSKLGLSESLAITAVSLLFSLTLFLFYWLIGKITDVLFTREEQQGRVLKQFSMEIIKTLSTKEITQRMTDIICEELPVEKVFVFLRSDDSFVLKYSSDHFYNETVSFDKSSPCVTEFDVSSDCYFMSEFKYSPRYCAMWAKEKEFLDSIGMTCAVALRDEEKINGFILVSQKPHARNLDNLELDFLLTVSSITSVAMKNAGLYEQMYYEARIDSLTGLRNYRSFTEELSSVYQKDGEDSLALIYIEIAEINAYTKLHGNEAADIVITKTTEVINTCVSHVGSIFHFGDGIFALLIKGMDVVRAKALSTEIVRKIGEIRARRTASKITVNCGIAIAPLHSLSSSDLKEHASLALQSAKAAGKSEIAVYDVVALGKDNVVQKAREMIDSFENQDSEMYKKNGNVISTLLATMQAKIPGSDVHSRRVAFISLCAALAYGMDKGRLEVLYNTALLHDVGKITFTKEDFTGNSEESIRKHTENAQDLIRFIPDSELLIPGILSHHECWDGNGCPRSLSGNDIPLIARIISIADYLDHRLERYGENLTEEVGDSLREEIEEERGRTFDPKLVDIVSQILGNNSDFIFRIHNMD